MDPKKRPQDFTWWKFLESGCKGSRVNCTSEYTPSVLNIASNSPTMEYLPFEKHKGFTHSYFMYDHWHGGYVPVGGMTRIYKRPDNGTLGWAGHTIPETNHIFHEGEISEVERHIRSQNSKIDGGTEIKFDADRVKDRPHSAIYHAAEGTFLHEMFTNKRRLQEEEK